MRGFAFRFLAATAIAAPFALTMPASAQQPGEVQQRFDNQQQRINNGIATGALTRHEAAVDESHLHADEGLRNRQLAHDPSGHLTPHQRAVDNHFLNRNSTRIYNTKHNGATGVPR
jgi:hypothetical protein